MKLGMYLKESWYNLRKDRVYSAVYIIGTGFSLALVMAYWRRARMGAAVHRLC